jgi:hypothetical protein
MSVFPAALAVVSAVTAAFLTSWLNSNREKARMTQERAFRERIDWYVRITRTLGDYMFSYVEEGVSSHSDERMAEIQRARVDTARRLAEQTFEAFCYAPAQTLVTLDRLQANLEILRSGTNRDAVRIVDEMQSAHFELSQFMRDVLGLERLFEPRKGTPAPNEEPKYAASAESLSGSEPPRTSVSQRVTRAWFEAAQIARRWWHTRREKSSPADVAMMLLTLGTAVAAFWSAFIFQGQLKLAREAMETQSRPWLTSGVIEIKDTTFLAYPDNPTQARSQMDFEIDIPLKNVGFSPALNVHNGVIGTMTRNTTSPSSMETMMQSACGEAGITPPKEVGQVVFPNSEVSPIRWPVNMMAPDIEITEIHRAWLAVCTTYDSDAVGKTHHTKVWLTTWPITGKPTELRRSVQPNVIYYSLPIVEWEVVRTEAD